MQFRLFFNKVKNYIIIFFECLQVIYIISYKDNIILSLIGFCVPVITTSIGTYKNKLFSDFQDGNNIKMLVAIFVLYEIITSLVQSYFMWRRSNIICIESKSQLEFAIVKSGLVITGEDEDTCKDILDNIYKISDFAIVPGMIWSTLISFIITLHGIKSYNSQIIIITSSLVTLVLLIYINDISLYERDKYNPKIITDLSNKDMVLMRLATGATIDHEYRYQKMNKQDRQSNIQRIVVCILNFVIIWITLSSGSKQYVLNFMSITWLISSLAGNIKGLQYYSFVKDYINIYNILKDNELKYSGKKIQIQQNIDSLRLDNVSFNYTSNMGRNSLSNTINNLDFIFIQGKIYCLQGENAIGKSSLFNALTQNINGGNIFIGRENRDNLTFKQNRTVMGHVPQSSKFTPLLKKEDIDLNTNRDKYLINGLEIADLSGKSFNQLSGGQKQRVILYLFLISKASILLLDETLSEISNNPSQEHPTGLQDKVIQTLVNWPELQNKIIIMICHGNIFEKYKADNVVVLQLDNISSKTKLIKL